MSIFIFILIIQLLSSTFRNSGGGGGVRKGHLNDLACEIWLWCKERDIWFSCFHIPGRLNVTTNIKTFQN